MRHFYLIGCGMVLLLVVVAFLVVPAPEVQALPEYSAQTGEPCASCHISPSGGGTRGPRGLAWVAGGKGAQVPDLVKSLEILGVHITVNEADYQTQPGQALENGGLPVEPARAEQVSRWLRTYEGN